MSKSIPYTPSTTTPTPMPLVWHILMNCICMNWTSMWLTWRERVSASGKCHAAQARASAYPSQLSFTIYLVTVQVRSLNLYIIPPLRPLAHRRRAKAEMKGCLSFKNLLKVCITMIFCLSNPEYIKTFTRQTQKERQKSWLVISVVKFILISSCSVDSCLPSSCQLQNK